MVRNSQPMSPPLSAQPTGIHSLTIPDAREVSFLRFSPRPLPHDSTKKTRSNEERIIFFFFPNNGLVEFSLPSLLVEIRGSLYCLGALVRICGDSFVLQCSMRGENTDGRREVQLGPHTIQTHGVRLARNHLHDWVVLILLAAVVIALHFAPPFSRFVGKGMMTYVSYPVKQSTVPAWGVLYSVLITAVVTTVVKNAVGRPRPDFFWRCFPDGKQLYDQVTGGVICHGEKSFLKDGRKSFPSGHTSWSFAGLGFLSLYLSGKIKVFDCQGHVAKLCIMILPLLIASLVGISRIDDYRHHWEDVFAGSLLGFIMAMLCYLHFFPPPYHHQGWGPYAYFHMLEELQVANSHNAESQQSVCGHHVELSTQHNSRTSRNDLEAGRVVLNNTALAQYKYVK
uniref:Phosphatidic acid phosphatase type 2/haloperoxidase domain-containing protein n=1 Tax=Oryza meridionalis TaxID=40149 RepID=A0A0E0BWV7_9ORYZ